MTSEIPTSDDTQRIPHARRAEEKPETEPEPEPVPRRRGRRVLKVLAGAVAVLAFLAVADRWAVLYAQDLAAEQARKALKLKAAPEVRIDGFPFLTQVAAGDLDRVQVTLPDLDAGPVSIAQVKATVDDIRIAGWPTGIDGVDLGKVRGDVLLDFADLTREVGASQVRLAPGREPGSVLARGRIPVAGTEVDVRADAQVRREGRQGVALTVANTRLVVPDVLTYTPGKGGGLQLAAPATGRMDRAEFEETTGERLAPGRLLKGPAVDALVEHPALLEPAGIDPSLLRGLREAREPKVAEAMEFSAALPSGLPGDLGLRRLSVTPGGIRARLTGADVSVPAP
ncbi:LmeA family phospholipid-binding protein [Streptomyces xanthii]|uniref:DUF2993 domain-containing protein n=1 Tax=Streptomyces xanthii TaxID=2768069 RepID=A0A7H1B7B9_9ACTN|nr:DUF2993 domain-containing protein [Streptomyces xanthii]QNS04624.1 DUF2993 domain-containing protein [Streptomyces xanthii]